MVTGDLQVGHCVNTKDTIINVSTSVSTADYKFGNNHIAFKTIVPFGFLII